MLPIQVLVPTEEAIRFLWAKFRTHRQFFPKSFIEDPIGFAIWIGSRSTLMYVLGTIAEPVGVIVFTDIVPNDSAFVHILVWNRKGFAHEDLIDACSKACEATMRAHDLHRITSRLPNANAHARPLLKSVGFVLEGELRKSIDMGDGVRTNEWIYGLLREDLLKALKDTDVNGIIKMEPPDEQGQDE